MQVLEQIGYIPAPQRYIAILWLSFLMAGLATTLFFTAIDPMELGFCVDFPQVSRTAAYTIGFFLFWMLTCSSSLLTIWFLYPRPPVDTSVGNNH